MKDGPVVEGLLLAEHVAALRSSYEEALPDMEIAGLVRAMTERTRFIDEAGLNGFPLRAVPDKLVVRKEFRVRGRTARHV